MREMLPEVVNWYDCEYASTLRVGMDRDAAQIG